MQRRAPSDYLLGRREQCLGASFYNGQHIYLTAHLESREDSYPTARA